jgi:diphosphomevalonate decarboxylase
MTAKHLAAAARARTNIALVKYWGKADPALNTPAVGSISITLADLWSDTRVEFDPDAPTDSLLLDGRNDAGQTARVSAFLDLVRAMAGVGHAARVVSENNFPTAAGLASSASGFAALAAAATAALGLKLDSRALSILARRGSGSAARSIFGGFVEMHRGRAADGSDAFAEPLAAAEHWPLQVVIAVTARGPKSVGSTLGMDSSAATSPFYDQWVATSPRDLRVAREAIRVRDFQALAEISEHSCLKMHAMAQATRPPLVYFKGATVDCLHRVRELRAAGTGVFFTIDAGPQLKAVCLPEAVGPVRAALAEVPGVETVLATGLGPGVVLSAP